MRFDIFLEFLREYFRGSTGQAEHREMFICRGDPATAKVKDRGVVWVDGISGYISSYIKSIEKIKKWNIYMGVGFVVEYLTTPEVDKMLYDRIAFDLDYDDPNIAVSHALNFAKHIEKHGATPLVFESGFKGAHVVIPLSKPVDWGTYQLLWRKLYGEMAPEARGMVDMNMLQWNRLDRVPLTYNVKTQGSRFCKIIYPDEYTWSDFKWSELKPLDPSRIKIVKVITPQIIKPRIIAPRSREMSWVWKVVKNGLPDGRKRFILYVLVPYLVNINKSEEDVLETCREFLDNSCRNHGNCGKVYDSWIRSVVRSSRTHRFRGFGLSKLKEKDQELYTLISEALR